MSTVIAVPDELVEKVKFYVRVSSRRVSSRAPSQAEIERFFIEAARKRLREIRARQMEAEYYKTHARRTAREVYEKSLKEIITLEAKYGMSSERFVHAFESGEIDEDPDDPISFYHWRTLYYGLQHIEKKQGFKREMVLDEQRAV